jgi:excisionase family DNA binding protein
MGDEFYTLEQVAALLDLHVRTVRAYVREGRIKAVRIGKQYRVARQDLEQFTGKKLAGPGPAVRTRRRTEVSSVVQIDAIDPANASRIANTLVAVSGARPRDDDSGVDSGSGIQVSCRYNEAAGSLKIIMAGDVEATTGLLQMITLLLEQPR